MKEENPFDFGSVFDGLYGFLQHIETLLKQSHPAAAGWLCYVLAFYRSALSQRSVTRCWPPRVQVNSVSAQSPVVIWATA